MRINVYTEELTPRVEIVEKNGFRGLRFYLKSHPDLHDRPDDDDVSAVTFWGLSVVGPLMTAAVMRLDQYHGREKG